MKKTNTIRIVPAKPDVRVKHPHIPGHIINGEIDIVSTKEVKRLIRFGDLAVVETKKKIKKEQK